MIIYNFQLHYCDNRCSPESWSLLLTLLLAKNNGGACALRQSVKKYNTTLLLKDMKLCEYLVASFYVPARKHEAKHGYITPELLFVCFTKQLK